MALTSTQQQKAIYYLGWTGKTLIPESTHYNSYIAARLINLNVDIENQVNKLLQRLDTIDDILDKSLLRMSTEKIDDITLNPHERELLRKERWARIRELSDVLDIVIVKQGGNGISVTS